MENQADLNTKVTDIVRVTAGQAGFHLCLFLCNSANLIPTLPEVKAEDVAVQVQLLYEPSETVWTPALLGCCVTHPFTPSLIKIYNIKAFWH